jgi:hypothetical protein
MFRVPIVRYAFSNLVSHYYSNTNTDTVITAITTGATATTHSLAIYSFYYALHFLISSTRGGSQGTQWRSWLRHCATSRKVAVSIPVLSFDFFVDIILPAALWSWDRLSLKRNEYQKYFLGSKGGRCVELTTLPISCADCHEIREPQPPRTLWACPGL